MRIKGKIAYCYVAVPDTRYEDAWKVDVVVTKEERDRIVAATGLKFNRCDGDFWEALGDYKIKITRNVERKGKGAGTKNQRPQFAIEGKPTDDIPMVANGSEAEVEFTPYNWTFDGRSGVGADFKGINITKLIEYVPESTEEETPDPAQDNEEIKW